MHFEEKLWRISQLSCLSLFILALVWTANQNISGEPVSWWLIIFSFFTVLTTYSENNYHLIAALVWSLLFVIGISVIIGLIIGQLGFGYFYIKIPYLDFIVLGIIYSFLLWLPEIGSFLFRSKASNSPS